MLSFLVATPSYTLTSAPRAPSRRAPRSRRRWRPAPPTSASAFAIQGGFVEHMDALGRQSGVVATEVRTPEELAAVDAIILPGGESTAIGHGLVDAGLLQPLRDFVKEKPAWGVCAGLIMLADSLDDGATSGAITSSDQKRQFLVGGLDVTVRRNAFGRQINSAFRPMEVWDKHADELGDAAYFIRAPAVVDAGSDVEVLARVGSAVEAVPDPSLAGSVCAVRQGKLMGTSVRRRPRPPIFCAAQLLGAPPRPPRPPAQFRAILLTAAQLFPRSQFHPEISRDDTWLRHFLNEVCGGDCAPVEAPLPHELAAPWSAVKELEESGSTAVRHAPPRRMPEPSTLVPPAVLPHATPPPSPLPPSPLSQVKRAFAVFQKGGVIMDVTNGEQARIAEAAGAVAVMALERIPADIKADGGVARLLRPPRMIIDVMDSRT